MDSEISDFVDKHSGTEGKTEMKIESVGSESEPYAVEFTVGGETRRFVLKPVRELYGEGLAKQAKEAGVQPTDPTYAPLYQGIETGIAGVYRRDPYLLDSDALWALEHLAQNPDGEIKREDRGEEVAWSIDWQLRVMLSIAKYSRQEIRTALRTVARSVKRHGVDGSQGYLRFIVTYV